MPRNLEIFNRGDWFLQEGMRDDGNFGYPIYYRHAIAYSIAINIIAGKDSDWMAQQVDSVIAALDKDRYYQCKDFIELYPFAGFPLAGNLFAGGTKGIPKGVVLVDQTNSYYPLVFYGENNERDGKPRVSALKHSLVSVKDGLTQIFDKLNCLEDKSQWDEDFQNELWEIYPGKPNT
ncbi:hypothetical protein HUN01_28565 [Nostoc edaphicum CCNP1411]|uniref:Uncharacterized protein n=1 Tax=Nostoc edaphicum CCNP1411 TaxID=1472755 RepID=A0A7D7LEX7_9NOSO|nr:hypothetical protein [Nostoc edaphicum]QMS91358.1 hypothetical protein HUN01_28565 [Nostoc edaphicum CCNP1411]